MKPGLLNNRDFLAGLLFIGFGCAGFIVAQSYPFGSLQEMGPGFFPRVLGLVLVGFGLITALKGLRSPHTVDGPWGWVPLFKLTAALLLFGRLMEDAGLLPALVTLVVVSAWAGREFKLLEVFVLTLVLCLLAIAIFVWGLGLPYSMITFGAGG